MICIFCKIPLKKKQLLHLVELFNLKNKMCLYPNQLSFQESEKVYLVHALLKQPLVFFLENPFDFIKKDLQNWLTDLSKKIQLRLY